MRLKTMFVAAIAALALVALVGAGTASATKICQNGTTDPCSAAYASGTVISGALKSGTNAVLTTSGGSQNPTITCSASTVGVTTTNGGGGTGVNVTGNLTSLSFSSCTSANPTGCSASATVTGLPTSGSLAFTSGKSGNMTVAAPDVAFTCSFFGFPIVCHFGNNNVTGTIAGGSPATITYTNAAINSSGSGGGFVCPTSASWNATYNTTGTNAALWVTNG